MAIRRNGHFAFGSVYVHVRFDVDGLGPDVALFGLELHGELARTAAPYNNKQRNQEQTGNVPRPDMHSHVSSYGDWVSRTFVRVVAHNTSSPMEGATGG